MSESLVSPEASVPTLSASVVTFAPDPATTEQTLLSLARSTLMALEAGTLRDPVLTVVDNGPDDHARSVAGSALDRVRDVAPQISLRLLSGHGNVGYGAGHNLAIRESQADFHLVLNPDVTMTPDAIANALEFMHAHPEVGALAPRVTDESGEMQYLCKRRPTVLALALRAFAPEWLKRRLDGYLARYEMRDLIADRVVLDVPIISGAFMFFRRGLLQQLGGFDAAYFVYFEDFDLSLRAGRVAKLAYVPDVRIVHHGGGAARKGWHHVRLFVRSGITYFNRHGWRFV
jgi:GT2 family glycosyltransferase